jgi:transposase
MLMGQVGRVRAMARTTRELTDAQWAKLAPLLPPQRPRMGHPPKDHRLIVEAIVDKAAHRQRNHVERTVNRLKGWRRVATR